MKMSTVDNVYIIDIPNNEQKIHLRELKCINIVPIEHTISICINFLVYRNIN